jgi:hypothetical protein
MPLLLLLGLGAALFIGMQGKSRPPIPPPMPGPVPGPLPAGVDPTMKAGATYGFAAQSPFDVAHFTAALADVGATIETLGQPIAGTFSGTFIWTGHDGEPTENLPGVTWILIQAIPTVIGTAPHPPALPAAGPQHVVSGMGEGVRFGGLGYDGLRLSGLEDQVYLYGQLPYQNIAQGSAGAVGALPACGPGGGQLLPPNPYQDLPVAQLSQSRALPLAAPWTGAPQRAALELGQTAGARIAAAEQTGPGFDNDPRVMYARAMRARLGG